MYSRFCFLLFIIITYGIGEAYPQASSQEIYSDYVLYQKRARLDKDLRENIVAKAFNQNLDSNSEHRFESACMAVSQFLFEGPEIQSGFKQLFREYNWLQFDTRRSFLEAVYAVGGNEH